MSTRTFIAIELTDDLRAALQREVARLGRALPAIQWSDPTNLHLTLAFLGDLDDARLAAATEAARVAASGGVPFRLEVAGLGTFGPEWAPRVVWAGVRGETQRLMALQEALATALEARGFPRDARPFSAHITLARIKNRLDDASLARLRGQLQGQTRAPLAVWPADSISVMKSELLRPAARYTQLSAFALGAKDP